MLEEIKLLTREDINIGDSLRVQWNGYPEVPKWLSGMSVEVIGFTRTKVKVCYFGSTYTVRYDQLRIKSENDSKIEKKEEGIEMREDLKRLQKIQGGMMGVAVGDALGATLEFLPKNGGFKKGYGYLTEIIGGGFMDLKPGETTDDTDMTIAVAKGILENPKDPKEAIGKYFMEWYATNPKDLGISCRRTFEIYDYMKKKNKKCDWDLASYASHNQLGCKSAGNGTLMRCLPVAFAYKSMDEVEKISRVQSQITHYDDMASDACVMYNNMVLDILKGIKNKRKIVENNIFGKDYNGVFEMEYTDLNPSGFVVDTFRCALFCFLHTESFEECVCMAVNLCGDADTIGAIVGGLAGTYYGISGIPKRWLDKIILKEELLELANGLYLESK